MLPSAEHRFCAVHMYGNWSKTHRGTNLKIAFWKCVKVTSYRLFGDAITVLKGYSKKVVNDLLKIDPSH